MVRRNIALGLVLGFLGACAHQADKVETVFYPMPPEQPRLQFLTSLTKEEDFGESNAFREFLLGKQEEGKRLARPYAMAHEKGMLYIADKTVRKIMIVTGGDNFAAVVKYFGSGCKWGVSISYAIQDQPGGIAGRGVM